MSDVTASEAPGVADVRESAGATVAPDAATTSDMGKMPRMARSLVTTEDAGTRGAVRARGAEKAPDMAGAPDVAGDAATPTLILFTRVPRAGQAKTRLIPALGEHGAAEFQWRLLARLLGELRHGAEQGLWRLRVYYCGTEGFERLRSMAGEGVVFVEQADNADLGVRMRAALERELGAGAPVVGLMGSDLPEATAGVVAEALGLLEDPAVDVSLCPVEDGGYWFVGLKRPFPQLFEGTVYGGASVFEDALAACAAHGRAVAAGPRLHDVDTPEDLAWFEGWAAGSQARTAPAV
ncbi:MAG: TIGR04282 family arsenosugar biosynthesis glycosyltransferase [Coriobacteriales bacterium]|nr:TIGR04282 family arsenosugar biosynthesis glycosyltransferase [Coriobacteriales bacterium]